MPAAYYGRQGRGVEVAKLLPLRQVQDDVCAGAGLDGRPGVAQLRVPDLGVRHRLRVEHGHRTAGPVDRSRHVECRGVPDVIAVRFESRTEDADPLPGEITADLLARQVDHPSAATLVDCVYFAKEPDRLVDAEFFGPGHERTDVLGQAAAAEPKARMQEAAADAGIEGQCRGKLGDVGAGGLADLGHRVDEGDLGCQEGVGCHLDQLGRGEVGDDQRDAGVSERRPELTKHLLGVLRFDSDH